MEVMRNFKFAMGFFVICFILNKLLTFISLVVSKKGSANRKKYKMFCNTDLYELQNEAVFNYISDILEELGYKQPVIDKEYEKIICYKNNTATAVYFLQSEGKMINIGSIYSIIGKVKTNKLKKCIVFSSGYYDSDCYKEIKNIKTSGIDLKLVNGSELVKFIRKIIEKEISIEGEEICSP